jgi:hypothetical protein
MSTDLTVTDNSPIRPDDKFDRVVKHWRDPSSKLPQDLQVQLNHWITIHGILATGRYPKTTQQLNAILKAIPGISPRTARNYLADTKRFFVMAEQPDLAYERNMVIEQLRADMHLARRKGDLRALAALTKLYIDVIGANKPEAVVENKTIINILNYNPEQLGGQVISDEALDKMIENFRADDQKKKSQLFDDYEDVSASKK